MCIILFILLVWGVWSCSLFLYLSFLPFREREQLPHFAQPGTFEFEYASRWKGLHEMEKQQREQVDKNIKEAKEKLEAELESAKHEHQLMMMRQGRCLRIVFWLLCWQFDPKNDCLPLLLTYIVSLPFFRSNETSGGAEETGGAPQPGAAEAKADRDEVC